MNELVTFLIPTLVMALLSACVPWLVPQVNRWRIAAALVIGLALAILGMALSMGPYPWTILVVLLVALSAGILVGRSIPARTWPFLIFLLALSALDILQIALSHPAPPSGTVIPPPGARYGNFFLLLPWGPYNLGIGDIFVIASMAEHWRRRGRSLLFSLGPGVIGTVLAYLFVLFIYHGVIPFVPFLTLGWLCALALAPALARKTAQPAAVPERDPA